MLPSKECRFWSLLTWYISPGTKTAYSSIKAHSQWSNWASSVSTYLSRRMGNNYQSIKCCNGNNKHYRFNQQSTTVSRNQSHHGTSSWCLPYKWNWRSCSRYYHKIDTNWKCKNCICCNQAHLQLSRISFVYGNKRTKHHRKYSGIHAKQLALYWRRFYQKMNSWGVLDQIYWTV